MLDFDFAELAVVAVVALIVVGPKRLPVVARMAGKIFGQVNRYVAQVKREVEKEMQLAEVAELKKQFTESSQSLANGINKDLAEFENKVQEEVAKETLSITENVESLAATTSPQIPQVTTEIPTDKINPNLKD